MQILHWFLKIVCLTDTLIVLIWFWNWHASWLFNIRLSLLTLNSFKRCHHVCLTSWNQTQITSCFFLLCVSWTLVVSLSLIWILDCLILYFVIKVLQVQINNLIRFISIRIHFCYFFSRIFNYIFIENMDSSWW